MTSVVPSVGELTGIVMIVDPDPCNWLGALLEGQGHTLVRHSDPASARQRVSEEDPDLVVLHAEPLDAEAITLCGRLHEDLDGVHPIVVESPGPLSPAQRIEMLRAGAWDCIDPPTPSQLEGLMLRLRTFLRAHRATLRERLGLLVDTHTGLYNRLGLTRRARELGALLFRTHEPVACVVFELTVIPESEEAISHCARLLADEGRVSDVLARLGEQQVAMLAPHTDLAGAVRLAERMARSARQKLSLSEHAGVQLEIRAAYDAVPSAGYVPVQPIDLVAAAAASLRQRPAGGTSPWLRRSGGHAAPTEPPN
jgi:PleD family two-component response regulator